MRGHMDVKISLIFLFRPSELCHAAEHLSTHNTCKPTYPCHAGFTLPQTEINFAYNPLRLALEGHVDFPEPASCCVASQQLIGSRPSVEGDNVTFTLS